MQSGVSRVPAEAGAAILHLHARDPKDGRPTPDPDVFMQFLPRIKQATNAVVNITTGGGHGMTLEERLAAPLLDERIKESRHPIVVLRVHRMLVDDQLADVVFNCFGHRLPAPPNTRRQIVNRGFSALDQQLDKRHLVEGGDLPALISLNVGVKQVAHRRLV